MKRWIIRYMVHGSVSKKIVHASDIETAIKIVTRKTLMLYGVAPIITKIKYDGEVDV